MSEIVIGSTVFTGLILLLVGIVLSARSLLRSGGVAHLTINRDKIIEAEIGETLLSALDKGGLRLPTSCGGKGTCGLCRVQVEGEGSDSILPVERIILKEDEISRGERLACQVILRGDLQVAVSPALLGAEYWRCEVTETRWLAPLIKEIVLALPAGEEQSFPAGCYVIVVVPPYELSYEDIDLAPEYESDWSRMGLNKLQVKNDSEQNRAYSLVNRPGDTNKLILNIRLALPPPMHPDVSPGLVSSYLFGLRVGDELSVSGHYGDFFVQDTDREIILIGGGVGMAPLYAHVHEQLIKQKSQRTISYWYGARECKDIYYADEMELLAREHENFSWHLALSEPAEKDAWDGEQGYIHEVIERCYLHEHPAPQDCEYYLCGPPLMIKAVHAMLDRLGVPQENIFHDDFGD